eukprot:COSAG02_NODE_876_length_16272_cov_138.802510_17_plen_95_part_00
MQTRTRSRTGFKQAIQKMREPWTGDAGMQKRYKYPILSPGTVSRWDCRRVIQSIGTQFSESARDEWPECDDVRLDRAPVPSWSERPLGSVATTK